MESAVESEEERIFKRINILVIVALALLLTSLFTPWWGVVVTDEHYGGPFEPSHTDAGFFSPLWSPWVISPIGTKLSIHFLNLFVQLMGSLVLLCLSRITLTRKQWLSPPLMWGAASFCAVGVIFFSVFFPAIVFGWDVFWMWGSWGFSILFSEYHLSVYVMPGFFFAVISLILQIFLAVRLTFGKVHETLIRRDIPPAPTKLRRGFLVMRSLVIPVCLLVTAATIWAGLSYSPTISASAYMNDWDFTHRSFEPGDRATVVGTVTNSTVISTSYGKYTLIELDDTGTQFALEGDRSSSYPIGNRASIPIEFRKYSYNGLNLTWADEGYAPLPMMFAMSVVFAAVSRVAGIPLLPDYGDTNGSRLWVLLPYAFPLEVFNLGMTKVEGPPYVGESGAVGSSWPPATMIDKMEPLHPGISENGTVDFTDVNDNGLLDWGDTFDLNLPSTEHETHFQTYVLGIYGPLNGYAYIIVRDKGPFMFYLVDSEVAEPYYFLTMPADQVSDDRCSSRVEILNRFGPEVNTTAYILRLRHGISGTYSTSIPATTTGTSLESGGYVYYDDLGAVGVLDVGDAWVFVDIVREGYYELDIRHEISGHELASMEWICGVGANIGRRPRVNLSLPLVDPSDPERLIINVTSVEWFPAGDVSDYQAVLLKNETPLLPPSGDLLHLVPSSYYPAGIEALPFGPSDDRAGTWIEFNDADENNYLGPGDYFAVNNTARQSRYELVLYYGGPGWRAGSISWTT